MYACTYVCILMYVYLCMYVCMHVCIYVTDILQTGEIVVSVAAATGGDGSGSLAALT
jgi:hypothetical protein